MTDWKTLNKVAASLPLPSGYSNVQEGSDDDLSLAIIAATCSMLAKEGPVLFRDTQAKGNGRPGLVLWGSYPHEGLDTILAAWILGIPLEVHAKKGIPDVIRKFVGALSPQPDVRLNTGPIQRPDAFVSELNVAEGDKRLEYLEKCPALLRKPSRTFVIATEPLPEVAVRRICPHIFRFNGRAPESVASIIFDKPATFSAFRKISGEYLHAMQRNTWMNDYEYRKSVIMLNREPHHDNGWVLFREGGPFPSLAGTMYFQIMDNQGDMIKYMMENELQMHQVIDLRDLKEGGSLHPELLTTAASWVRKIMETAGFLQQVLGKN